MFIGCSWEIFQGPTNEKEIRDPNSFLMVCYVQKSYNNLIHDDSTTVNIKNLRKHILANTTANVSNASVCSATMPPLPESVVDYLIWWGNHFWTISKNVCVCVREREGRDKTVVKTVVMNLNKRKKLKWKWMWKYFWPNISGITWADLMLRAEPLTPFQSRPSTSRSQF